MFFSLSFFKNLNINIYIWLIKTLAFFRKKKQNKKLVNYKKKKREQSPVAKFDRINIF